MRFWMALGVHPLCRSPPSHPAAPQVAAAPSSPTGLSQRAMARPALLLLAWLAPMLAFPTAAPGTTASYLEGTATETTGFTQSFTEEGITKTLDEVTTSGSRGRRSEYIAEYDSMTEEDYMTDEPSIISTEQHVQKRTTVEHSISLDGESVIGDP